jgi:hypothetical protein
MTIYSVDKLMEETRKVAANYHQLTGEVLPVASELAKHDAINLFKFAKPDTVESGVDLIGAGHWDGKKVQVKSRVIFDSVKSRQMVGQINQAGLWDEILLVLFDADYFPGEILMLSRDKIIEELGSATKAKRGSMSVAKFKSISKSIWIRPAS